MYKLTIYETELPILPPNLLNHRDFLISTDGSTILPSCVSKNPEVILEFFPSQLIYSVRKSFWLYFQKYI